MFASTSLKLFRRYLSSTTKITTNIPTSACPKEIEFFQDLTSIWWDKNGNLQALHKMNPVRLRFLEKDLQKAGVIKTNQIESGKPLKDLKILDAGCGGGILAEAMTKLGAKVTGIDASSDLIRVAKNHMKGNPELERNLNYENILVEEFALTNKEKFDVVVSSEVIEHVLDKDIFAEHVLRCLKPGGSAFFTTMNRTLVSGFYYIYICENWIKWIPKGTHQYEKFMTPKEMKDLFRKYDCVLTDVDGFCLNPFNGTWFQVSFPHFNYAVHAIKLQKSL